MFSMIYTYGNHVVNLCIPSIKNWVIGYLQLLRCALSSVNLFSINRVGAYHACEDVYHEMVCSLTCPVDMFTMN